MQSHPFMIVSWTEGQWSSLELVVDPQSGLTRILQGIAESNGSAAASNPYLAFYSGPHGRSEPMSEYGTVLMFASGLGIVAHIPYIKQLLHDGAQCRARTKRIHLIWQLQEPGDELSVQDLIDDAYEEDARSGGYILQISTYYKTRPPQGPAFGGSHGRNVRYSGNLKPSEILQSEMNGEYDVYIQGKMERRSGRPQGDILIAVAAASSIRDDLRTEVVRLSMPVRLVELEFQPYENQRVRSWLRRMIHHS
ncbi:MAG: hypothetical protein Q9209_007156 [Squamulea sp. 1 TL-2023]